MVKWVSNLYILFKKNYGKNILKLLFQLLLERNGLFNLSKYRKVCDVTDVKVMVKLKMKINIIFVLHGKNLFLCL